jgi:hypothetical protein
MYPTAAIGGYWSISSSAATRFIDCVIPSSTTPSSTPARIRGDQEAKAAGPLVVSYVHERTANPIEDCFDYVFITDEIGVIECSYDYQGERVAGSDHGIATAELRLCLFPPHRRNPLP